MSTSKALASMERVLRNHVDAEVKNLETLRSRPHRHTTAMCRVIEALLLAFPAKKIVVIPEAEIGQLGCRARPEDIVAWIESVGVFVLEIKSHTIDGISKFENNVPYVIYEGKLAADDLLTQPTDFAYKLQGQVLRAFDDDESKIPALYFAGWLPNVSQADVVQRAAEVNHARVWLSDMLTPSEFHDRLPHMKNITRGTGAERGGLARFMQVFGCTSGLRTLYMPRPVQPATMGHLLDQRNLELKRLTMEQESLAFSPNLVRGPKVIRGVAGSGKSIVLANAVVECLLRDMSRRRMMFDSMKSAAVEILVLCFNRALARYLDGLVRQCFEARKADADWCYPANRVTIRNIDRFAYKLWTAKQLHFNPLNELGPQVGAFLSKSHAADKRYDHVFIDEGQDFDNQWYPMIRDLARESNDEVGRSIVVFYDEAQNVYGKRRPGTSGAPSWKELLGEMPSNRGLKTIMRVGHRNTNEILTFSFGLLIGAHAARDPGMATFAELASYESEVIPDDPSLNHPNAGKPSVEKIGARQYRVNFAVTSGPPPNVHSAQNETQMLGQIAAELKRLTDSQQADVEPKDLLVLAHSRKAVKKIADTCRDVGLSCHVPVRFGDKDYSCGPDPRDEPFFQDGKITVSTIKAAKGLTAHVVFVTFLQELSERFHSSRGQEQMARAELHVACTRATTFLDLWGTPCELLDEALKLSDSLRSVNVA